MNFTKELQRQRNAACILARDLGPANLASPTLSIRAFDEALEAWIEAYREAMKPPYSRERPIPGVGDATPADDILKDALDRLIADERLYAWARLWQVHDSLMRGFGLSITGKGLADHIAGVRPASRLNNAQIDAMLPFFRESWQESGLYGELWKRFSPGYTGGAAEGGLRDRTLSFFVGLLERQWFLSSYHELRQVLGRLDREDQWCIRALMNFTPHKAQGAGLYAGHVIRTLGLGRTQREPGKTISDVLAWSTDSVGKAPTGRWRERRAMLEAALPPRTLESLARWVRDRPELRYFGDKPYRDDLFWRVWKSAAWHQGVAP